MIKGLPLGSGGACGHSHFHLLVDVLSPKSIHLLRNDLEPFLDILFGRVVGLQVVGHAIHWNVLANRLVINKFDGTKNLRAKVAHVNVIILVTNMNDKLGVFWQQALCYGLYTVQRNFTLNLILLNIIQAHVSDQEGSILSETPPIYFYHKARINDLLSKFSLKLGHNFLATFTILLIFKFFNFFHIRYYT